MKKNMKKKILFCAALAVTVLFCLSLSGCRRYEPAALREGDAEAEETMPSESFEEPQTEAPPEAVSESPSEIVIEAEEPEPSIPDRSPVKVKGIYLAANPVNVPDFMQKIIKRLDETELNAVVIDVKDDFGRITYPMEGVPLVDELEAVQVHIEDLPAVLSELKAHGVYCIARIVALKDPYIAERKPEWALHLADGSLFRDGAGDAWVNPYKREYWDYLVEISKAAGRIGFDEIQFDYIRFCTERGIGDVVYDEADTQGRDKITIISELTEYLSDALRAEGLFVSCDVFGTIIGSPIDAQSVGQDYTELAEKIDYICPMIYPSHYASGNFGLEHPDRQPYETIKGALTKSRSELSKAEEDVPQAVVRPWLQSFTASYLGEGNYREYNAETTRAQIQGVYDAGYDEWILWSASANYYYGGLLSPEDAAAEELAIAESRAALPPETEAEETAAVQAHAAETDPNELPPELLEALDGDDLSESDRAILSQEGEIIISDRR